MELRNIGINDDSVGRSYLENHLNSVLKDNSNIIKTETRTYVAKELPNKPTFQYVSTTRESFLAGPMGGVKVESVWEGARLITIIIKGGK